MACSYEAFAFNMRQERLPGIERVRQALTLAYNFEEQNRLQFFELNQRFHQLFRKHRTCFQRAAEGRELEILELTATTSARTVHGGVQAAGLRHPAGGT